MSKRALYLPIGFKLTAIVSLLLSLSLGGLTVLTTWFFTQDIERTLRENTLDRVELLSAKLETDFQNTINGAKLIAAAMTGGFIYEGTGREPTSELIGQNGLIRSIHVLERGLSADEPFIITQSAYADLDPEQEGIAARALAATQEARLEEAFQGERLVLNASPQVGEPSLAVVFPYQQASETEALSVILCVLYGDSFIQSLAARDLYSNLLCDSSGTLLVHQDREQMALATDLSGEPIVQDYMKGEASLKQMQFAGTDDTQYIGSWKRFFDGNLAVLSTVSRDTALEGVFTLQRRTFLITSMVLCFAMLLLFIFSKTLTTPIRRLMDAAIRIRDGDFTVKINRFSSDEIGKLSETFNTMSQGLAERDKIKNAFGKFVNKEVAERVLAGDIKLGGENKTAAIFFSDIRSFTSISERMNPHEVVEFLNEYMTLMVNCVNETHGVVDKFIGDAIMAIWGIPDSRGNDTENAINGALRMRKALVEFNKGRGSEKKPIIKIGCGINTGEVTAGQIGSPERMEYTCIGDAVNLASRIESLNKAFCTDILVSEYSYSLVRKIFRMEPMKQIRVKGKMEPQQIYAVLGRYDDPSSFSTIDELRSYLGLAQGPGKIDLESINTDSEEQKYEIIG